PAARSHTTRRFAGAAHLTELPADFAAELDRFGERESASLGILLLAASAVLLHRYSGRPAVVVGENVSGRNRAELEPLIGCLVGVQPMRMRVTGDQSLREVVRR